MNQRLTTQLLAGLALGATAFAGANDTKIIAPLTPLDDSWRFSLAVPGWVPNIVGDAGLGESVSSVDVSPQKLLRSVDMLTIFRGEIGKGRFGAQVDFIDVSLSDGVGSSGLVRKLDLRVDEIYAEFGVSYRLIEGKRGWVEARVGVRYINLFQRETLHPDAANIQTASTQLVDAVGDRLRTTLSESGLREVIARRIGALGSTPMSASTRATTCPNRDRKSRSG